MSTPTAVRLSLLTTSFMLALTGCATQGSLDSTRNDIDAVKTRLFTVERDQSSLRSENRDQLASLETNLKAELTAIRKITADTQATIDSTKAEMQALNGRVDDMAGSLKAPGEELTRYRNDADKRIITLEDRILKLQASLDELSKKVAEAAAQPKEAPAPPTADALYMKGLEAFKAGDMAGARERFQKFLEQQPQHELVPNAYYWIGETYYSEKSYEPAILAFQEIIKNFPNHEKTPAAMLKQALCFRTINDTKSAKYVLKKLSEGHPKSEEAKKAKELLKEIK